MDESSLFCAYLLDGKGGGKKIPLNEVESWSPEQGLLWMHFDGNKKDTAPWLLEKANLDSIIVDALITEDTRPRFLQMTSEGFLLILKGINVHPKAQPEDMISIRIWLEKTKIISVCRHHMWSVSELEKLISLKAGPKNSASFIVQTAKLLLDRMEPLIDELDSEMDAVELSFQNHNEALFSKISDIRISATTVRRYLLPQKEAIANLQTIDIEWFDKKYKRFIREHLDRTYRFLEDLELVRDRAGIILDEIRNRMQGQMNKSMYIFSLVAVLFLPLTFLTGLFGINVGGIPGSETKLGFALFCLGAVILTALLLYIFRRLRWI